MTPGIGTQREDPKLTRVPGTHVSVFRLGLTIAPHRQTCLPSTLLGSECHGIAQSAHRIIQANGAPIWFIGL
jgi:hypothetical protein